MAFRRFYRYDPAPLGKLSRYHSNFISYFDVRYPFFQERFKESEGSIHRLVGLEVSEDDFFDRVYLYLTVGSFADQNAGYRLEGYTETVAFVFNTSKVDPIVQDRHLEELVFEETLPQNHVERSQRSLYHTSAPMLL